MKNSIGIKATVLAMMMSAAGFSDMIVTLDSSGALWKADTANVTGTKTLMATLTGGASYIDSAFDGQYLYGLRNDGTVYRSDLSGNVSAVSLTGWSSSIRYINADSGTLYGMNGSGDADVRTTDGSVAAHITGATTAVWGDFTVTDDGRIWLLNTAGGGGTTAWVYGYTNGYSGALSGFSQYLNFNSTQVGYALASAGNEFYCAFNNSGTSVYTSRTLGNATSTTFHAPFPVGLADMATGTSFYTANASGTIESTPLASGTRTNLGDLGDGIVGLEVIPEPTTLGLFTISAVGLLALRHFHK
jgi:hypothetical protein